MSEQTRAYLKRLDELRDIATKEKETVAWIQKDLDFLKDAKEGRYIELCADGSGHSGGYDGTPRRRFQTPLWAIRQGLQRDLAAAKRRLVQAEIAIENLCSEQPATQGESNERGEHHEQ